MAANTSPIFGLISVLSTAQVSAANTNRDGTGTIVDILTGDTDGTIIDVIAVVAVGTTSSGMVRLYISDGSNTRLWQEVAQNAPQRAVELFQPLRFDL